MAQMAASKIISFHKTQHSSICLEYLKRTDEYNLHVQTLA